MRPSPRALVGSLLAALVLVATVSCSKRDMTCAKSSVGCTCRNEVFTLGTGWSPVRSCEAPKPLVPGTVSTCCYDLDSAGESTYCRCTSAACRKSTRAGSSFCECAPLDDVTDNDYGGVDECTRNGSMRCCKSSSSCRCQEGLRCTSEEVESDGCTPHDVRLPACRAPGPGRGDSCSGLKWKKSAPKSGS